LFWTITGGTLGTLAVAGTVYGSVSANFYESPIVWGFFGLGSPALTTAIFAALNPEKSSTPDAVSISPLLLRDHDGHLAPGAALTLFGILTAPLIERIRNPLPCVMVLEGFVVIRRRARRQCRGGLPCGDLLDAPPRWSALCPGGVPNPDNNFTTSAALRERVSGDGHLGLQYPD
jgi:hypothetical protein